jgi:hypothetical protein
MKATDVWLRFSGTWPTYQLLQPFIHLSQIYTDNFSIEQPNNFTQKYIAHKKF